MQEQARVQSNLARYKDMLARIASVPFVFLGIGLYRAWLALFFRFDAFPGIGIGDYFVFEVAIGAACLVLALAAGKVVPLWSNAHVLRATVVSMTAGAALVALACFVAPFDGLKWAGLVLAGAGLGSVILMWAEFYGSINPVRVAFYHSLGIAFGETVKWLFMGMDVPYLVFFSVALPLACVVMVRKSMMRLPELERPRSIESKHEKVIPWKPIVLMAVCTFAGGFGALPAQPLVVGNVAGAVFACALVAFGILSASRWFNFDTVYKMAFPLFIIAFLLMSPSFGSGVVFMAASYDAGYTMLSMFIVIVLANLTYRYGVNPVWVSGIERAIRYGVEALGWAFASVLGSFAQPQQVSMVFMGITAVAIVVFAVMFFTESGLTSKWGLKLDASIVQDSSGDSAVAARVFELARQCNLSPREEEVLHLMAKRKTVAQMERELFVAQGTIKAHVSHIYKKLGVHSKADLQELLEDPERDQGE